MKISNRITLYTGLMVATMSAALLAVVYFEVSRSFYAHIQKQQEAHLRVAREQLDRMGQPLAIVDGKLVAGAKNLNGDEALVDRISYLVGGIATLYQKDIRIATNIRLPDGTRAVGTQLTGPAREAILDRGEKFRGESKTLGEPYLTAYDLLRNRDGVVIGMLQVGALKRSYSGALTTILTRSFIIAIAGILLIGMFVHVVMSKLTGELNTIANSRKVLLRSTFSGVFGVDIKGECSFINHAGAKFLGGMPDDFIGKKIHPLIHHGVRGKDEVSAEHCPLCQVFQSGNSYHNGEDTLWRLDESSFPADIQSFPLIENNRIAGAVVAFSDNTERQRIAREAALKKEKRTANRFARFYAKYPFKKPVTAPETQS